MTKDQRTHLKSLALKGDDADFVDTLELLDQLEAAEAAVDAARTVCKVQLMTMAMQSPSGLAMTHAIGEYDAKYKDR